MALLMLFSYSGPILMYNEFEKKMQGLEFMSDSRCLKTIEKVSFNIQRLHQEWTKVQCYQKGQFQLKKNGEKCPNFKIQMRHIWVIFKQCVPDFWLIFHSWQISQKSPDIKLEIAAQNPPKKGVGKIRYKKTAFNTGIEM